MSTLNVINHNNTKTNVDAKGVIWWSNPNVAVTLGSNGLVLNQLNGKFIETVTSPTHPFGVQLIENGKNSHSTATFNSLYARMVLGKKLKGYTLRLKSKEQGYKQNNVAVVPNYTRQGANVVDYVQRQVQLPLQDVPQAILSVPKFYTVTKGREAYRTEDFAIFPTLELANWHQDKVSKGKGNAQVVLDYDGGWRLAEAIYQQDVKYNKGRLYQNFADVMNNNKGIEDISEKDIASFKNARTLFNDKGLDAKYVTPELYKLNCSVEDAEIIQEKIEAYVFHAKVYEESLNKIKTATQNLNKSIAKGV